MPRKQLISEGTQLDCFKYTDLIYLLSIYVILEIKVSKINKAWIFVLRVQSQVREDIYLNNDFQ